MYKDFFSLTSDVFGVQSTGSDTFMGSQQASARDRLAAALLAGDTIVTVTGPVGSGKTTMVREALNAISDPQKVARIARIKLKHDEILELLLTELGVDVQPEGTIQRFTEFKRRIKDWRNQGTRVFIIVEDAKRIGVDALSELESLTSVDAGGATGASLVLMGLPDVDELLKSPELTRTRQRINLQLSLQPFAARDVQNYLTYRFRAAGGNVDILFETGAIDMIHRCSEGIPGVINKLCDATLNAAARASSNKISAALVQAVAGQDFGLQPDSAHGLPVAEPDVPHLIQDTHPGLEALPPKAPVSESGPSSDEVPSVASRVQNTTILEPQAPEPLTKKRADPDTVRKLDSALLPDTNLLRTLAELPSPANDDAPVPLGLQISAASEASEKVDAEDDKQAETATFDQEATDEPAPAPKEELPTLSDSMRIDPVARTAETTGSRDTKSLRKPNIDAFETAMATARKGPVELDVDATPTPEPAVEAASDSVAVNAAKANTVAGNETAHSANQHGLNLPEITLDSSLKERQREAEALVEERQKAQEDAAAEQKAKDDKKRERAKLGKLASDLGKAKSLEEIDDVAAETLFGEEFSQMAAAVAAMAAEEPANDSTMQPNLASEQGSDTRAETTAEESATLVVEEAIEPAVSFETLTPGDEPPAPDIDSSASRRFAMLKKMKSPGADVAKEARMPAQKEDSDLTPIENQFGSSMTQTLAQLKFEKPGEDAASESEQSGGFLSRFKRS